MNIVKNKEGRTVYQIKAGQSMTGLGLYRSAVVELSFDVASLDTEAGVSSLVDFIESLRVRVR